MIDIQSLLGVIVVVKFGNERLIGPVCKVFKNNTFRMGNKYFRIEDIIKIMKVND
jgi:primosomal protein N'